MYIIVILVFGILINIGWCWWNQLQAQNWKEQYQNAKKLYTEATNIKIEKQKQQIRLTQEIKDLQYQEQKFKQDISEYFIKTKEQVERHLDLEREQAKLKLEQYQKDLEDQKQKASYDRDVFLANCEIDKEAAAAELKKLKNTRTAAREALIREQQIKENKELYCLQPSENDLDDIHKLDRIKKDLHKPRILSMLIWQTYWQPLAKKQFPTILNTTEAKSGVYKITNLKTEQCYIGQAVDVYKRFCEHCKCGLGIDTPVGNKLYKAISEYGLENFSFELIEECSREQLNEKEKFYIELYEAKDFGYNGTGGNK